MLRKIYCFLILSSLILHSHAEEWSLKLSSNVEIRTWKLTNTYEKEERSLQGATIVLTKGGQSIAQTTSDDNGDFSIMVPANGEYLLTVSYPGCNTKRFSVNTNNVPPEFAKDSYKPTFSIGGFIMAKPFPGIDYSGLQQPLVMVQFMPKKKVFDHDDQVTEQGLNIVSKIAQAEMALIQKFCNTNKSGDVALAKPDCPLAKTYYQEAMAIIPIETYPVIQLQKVGECLKNMNAAAEKAAADKIAAEAAAKAKQEADAAAKAKANADAAAQTQANADAAAKAKVEADMQKAKAKEAETAKAAAAAEKAAKEKEGLARAKAEDEAEAKAIEEKRKAKEAEKKEAAAKAKAEEAAAAKIAADKKKEKEAKEKEGMARAKAEDEAEAKAEADKRRAKEEEAQKLKYETKSSEAEGQQSKSNSKVSVPSTVFGADKYKETIKKADDYFKMKRWAEAKPAYEEALKIRTDDPYAKSKLETVEKNLNAVK